MTQFKDKSAQAGRGRRHRSGCSPTRSCRRPTSCSTTPTSCRSAKTSASTSSSRATSRSRFNSRFGDTLRGARGADPEGDREDLRPAEPERRRCRSRARADKGILWLLDEPTKTAKKIKSAVTDTDGVVRFDPRRQAGRLEPADDLSVLVRALDRRRSRPSSRAAATATSRGPSRMPWSTSSRPIRERALELLADPAELDRCSRATPTAPTRSPTRRSRGSTTASGSCRSVSTDPIVPERLRLDGLDARRRRRDHRLLPGRRCANARAAALAVHARICRVLHRADFAPGLAVELTHVGDPRSPLTARSSARSGGDGASRATSATGLGPTPRARVS